MKISQRPLSIIKLNFLLKYIIYFLYKYKWCFSLRVHVSCHFAQPKWLSEWEYTRTRAKNIHLIYFYRYIFYLIIKINCDVFSLRVHVSCHFRSTQVVEWWGVYKDKGEKIFTFKFICFVKLYINFYFLLYYIKVDEMSCVWVGINSALNRRAD